MYTLKNFKMFDNKQKEGIMPKSKKSRGGKWIDEVFAGLYVNDNEESREARQLLATYGFYIPIIIPRRIGKKVQFPFLRIGDDCYKGIDAIRKLIKGCADTINELHDRACEGKEGAL